MGYEKQRYILYGKLSNLALTIDSTSQVKLENPFDHCVRNAAHGVAADNRFFVMPVHHTGKRCRERETVIYRAENVTGIAWHLLGVRKTEEKQTRRLSQVVPLKGGLLMSVAFFRPPNHRVPEGSVGAHPTFTSPVEVFRSVSATLSDSNNFRARRNRAPPLPLPPLA